MDMALAVTVASGEVYTFSHDLWFGEIINVASADEIAGMGGLDALRECYENEGSYVVDIVRTVEAL